ncbi:hypothetical protein CCH79_00000277 [Gambusia affinis]|uniref:G-protein coupled receptors family 1 profile domain-containing protein n=1 Tax=Gambusia affinis TaxID=33528 RepID=A0A315VWU3_GAMAF|nr:hypothetical protein CCH79_00000277 [Gambusia affinis]
MLTSKKSDTECLNPDLSRAQHITRRTTTNRITFGKAILAVENLAPKRLVSRRSSISQRESNDQHGCFRQTYVKHIESPIEQQQGRGQHPEEQGQGYSLYGCMYYSFWCNFMYHCWFNELTISWQVINAATCVAKPDVTHSVCNAAVMRPGKVLLTHTLVPSYISFGDRQSDGSHPASRCLTSALLRLSLLKHKPFDKKGVGTSSSGHSSFYLCVLFLYAHIRCRYCALCWCGCIQGGGAVVTVCGNLLIIVSVGYFTQLHTPTNSLIVSLAATDLLVGVLVFPFSMAFSLSSCLLHEGFICQVRDIFDISLSTCSILNLCCIAVDRYYAVCRPLTYRTKMTNSTAMAMILASWGISGLIGIGITIAGLTHEPCEENCSTEVLLSSTLGPTFSFYLPALVMLCIYLKIFLVAQRQARKLHINTNSGGTASKRERKATKTLAVVMGVFLICWTPLFVCITLVPFSADPVPVSVIETLNWQTVKHQNTRLKSNGHESKILTCSELKKAKATWIPKFWGLTMVPIPKPQVSPKNGVRTAKLLAITYRTCFSPVWDAFPPTLLLSILYNTTIRMIKFIATIISAGITKASRALDWSQLSQQMVFSRMYSLEGAVEAIVITAMISGAPYPKANPMISMPSVKDTESPVEQQQGRGQHPEEQGQVEKVDEEGSGCAGRRILLVCV